MTQDQKLKLVNSYEELKALVPGYKTRVKIDSDEDSKWMIYKGNENGSSDASYYSFIEVPDTLEKNTRFIIWSSWDDYLSFPGDECMTPDLKSTIVFNYLHRQADVITPDSEEYKEIKSLVKLWVIEDNKSKIQEFYELCSRMFKKMTLQNS